SNQRLSLNNQKKPPPQTAQFLDRGVAGGSAGAERKEQIIQTFCQAQFDKNINQNILAFLKKLVARIKALPNTNPALTSTSLRQLVSWQINYEKLSREKKLAFLVSIIDQLFTPLTYEQSEKIIKELEEAALLGCSWQKNNR